MVEKKKEKETMAKIIEVPTQMGLAYKLEDESIVSEQEMLVKIYNMLLELKTALV